MTTVCMDNRRNQDSQPNPTNHTYHIISAAVGKQNAPKKKKKTTQNGLGRGHRPDDTPYPLVTMSTNPLSNISNTKTSENFWKLSS